MGNGVQLSMMIATLGIFIGSSEKLLKVLRILPLPTTVQDHLQLLNNLFLYFNTYSIP